MNIELYLAFATFLFWSLFAVDLCIGIRSMRTLKDLSPAAPDPPPKVSIIIAARNEQAKVEAALQSVLLQDYENLEVIVVDDRSTDQTGELLQRMAKDYAKIQLVRVTELPVGWLGKNHALHLGSQHATGDFLLFTDADVVMHPATVRKAVGYAVERGLDHLTIGLEAQMPGLWLKMFMTTFLLFFAMYARPWKASDPGSSCHVGIGGFNLIRTRTYLALGGHQPIAMRPDDDMKLGKLIKRAGYRQEAVHGTRMIHVEWYDSTKALIHGLEKNAFAGLDYNPLVVLAGTFMQLLVQFWPFVAVFVTSGAVQIINALSVLLILTLCWDNARAYGSQYWYGIGFPVCTLFFLFILWRSMLVVLVRGGIIWRGTLYPLVQLKANKI
jgi:glycosyltransferase involved in cell wall biosynthesis